MFIAGLILGLIAGFIAGVLVGRKNKGKVEQAMAEADRLRKKLDDMKQKKHQSAKAAKAQKGATI